MVVGARKKSGISRFTRGWEVAQLERRIMLAGDVAEAIDGGTLPLPAEEWIDESSRGQANLVFVSPDVPNLNHIAEGLQGDHDFILLDSSRSALAQITEHLDSRSNVRSLHLIGHGDSGEIMLAGQRITTKTLDDSQNDLRRWSQSLTSDADVLIYGCDVASGAAGGAFVARLAQLTGADVAASLDTTGNPLRGGDWDLEFSVGPIESALALRQSARQTYPATLPITIRAAGATNDEQMLLQIGGVTVATYNNVGGNANAGQFETFTFDADGVSADDVRVVFTNDVWDPANGIDRNLRVDNITIDGEVFETEHPSVFSTGSWLPEDGIVPGFRQSEFLQTNGYFQYAELDPDPGDGSVISIRAFGTEGPEVMELRIDGTPVQTWTAIGTSAQTFSFTANETVTASQIQVAFTNDVWDPDNGIDYNLVVDWIDIDGQTFQTEDPSVFSTGSWLPEDGIVPGFRQSEILNTNGYFQYADEDPDPDPDPNDGSVIEIVAAGFEGDENMSLLIDGVTVESWTSIGTVVQSFSYTATDTVTPNQVRVAFTNDVWDPDAGIDSNLFVDRITIDGVDYETEHPSVFSTGSWLPEDGIVPGFRQSEILNTNGYFQYGGPAIANGTGFSTEVIASGLNQPISFAEAPDGRIFVTEKAGVVRVIENGQLLAAPFLDINLEVNSNHDRGLMGIALDPDFASNGYVYLQYVVELDPANPDDPDFNSPAGGRLIRVAASAANPNVADESTRVVIQDGHQMSHATHAVGDVDFDNAGNLIFTWGDGGFDPALRLAAQDPDSPQGKLFRIDRVTFEGVPGNPNYDPGDPSSIRSRVWALGIRNSWKISVDRATGDVYLGEVTDSGPEEINVLRADGSTILNYGWPYYEDTNRTSYGTVPPGFAYEPALVALPHTDAGGGDAIVGGAVFRGSAYPGVYDTRYFFANFNQGILYTSDSNGDFQQFGDQGAYAGAVDIQLASDGHIWIMSLFTGTIERLVYEATGSNNTAPVAVATGSQTAGESPLAVTLDATASNDDDGDALQFQWDFESDGIFDATGAIVTHSYSGLGRSTTTLVVTDGNGGSDTSVVEIDVLSSVPADGNLALGRPAIESDTDGAMIASRAVDGNTSGVFSDESIAQTVRTRTPLWEVDLGAVQNIGLMEIYTRTDGVNPLSNFWVLISANPISSGNLDAAQNDPGIWLYHEPGTVSTLESIAVNTLGRYVRIQLEGIDDILSLAEVKVIAA